VRGVPCALCLLFGFITLEPGAALAAAPGDPQALEQAWHTCVREAYARQPADQGRAGNELNALDECKAHEDALVTVLMTGSSAQQSTGTWAALVRPLVAWVDGFRR
jgi:hypothetical protein